MVIVALALGLALGIQAFLIKPFKIPSGSMQPTLDEGQRVLVNRFIYHFTSPKIGDIVVFHPPAGADRNQCGVPPQPDQPCSRPTSQQSDQNFIKRIVAGPGDRLSIRDGHPVVNGVINRDEPYIDPCLECNMRRPIRIPPGHYFMMGDNRGPGGEHPDGSEDSRVWGPVPQEWFIGKAFATYWPPERIGIF